VVGVMDANDPYLEALYGSAAVKAGRTSKPGLPPSLGAR
jgi:hypothetical protein